MSHRLVAASIRFSLAALALTTALAASSAAAPDSSQVPLRYSIKVSKQGTATKLVRLAFAYPTGAVLSTGCTRGKTGTGPCPVDGSPVEGITCTDGADAMTKCELRSTKQAPLVYDKGATFRFSVSQPDHQPTLLNLQFTGSGRYKASGNGA